MRSFVSGIRPTAPIRGSHSAFRWGVGKSRGQGGDRLPNAVADITSLTSLEKVTVAGAHGRSAFLPELAWNCKNLMVKLQDPYIELLRCYIGSTPPSTGLTGPVTGQSPQAAGGRKFQAQDRF
ncbi:hypothetical protein GCM10009530_34460 [Microbispora corallina]|uniref:Uncharacterized protein n=1 Tax=Microbispora corallina TaxID=83302 RepID=A0ABQ4G1Q7_9ACTN|nr:hypothetical protein Mco01_39790 [Microbispora corallina]